MTEQRDSPPLSVVIPAFDEEASIESVIAAVREHLDRSQLEHEIIVVVDGATDQTAERARSAGATVVSHPKNLGYGRSLKTGITASRYDLIAITDADRTYPVDQIAEMVRLAQDFDMVVGARQGRFYQGSVVKRIGRYIFRCLSEFSAGQSIPDINSGLRVFRRSQIMPFFPIISAGFSFTTTSTLAYLHNDLCVHYIPIEYLRRDGKSKVRHLRDSIRALQIIVEAILRFNPVKVFLLLALPFAILAAIALVAAIWNRDAPVWILTSVISASTSALILSMGFLAVATKPHRVGIPIAQFLRTETHGDQTNDT